MQGPILAFIYAVKEMLEEGQATLTALPVNVAFVFEGEEENGESLPANTPFVCEGESDIGPKCFACQQQCCCSTLA